MENPATPPPPPPSPAPPPPPSRPGAVPPQQQSSGLKTVLIILAVCGVVGGLLVVTCFAGIMLPALGKARQAARRIKSSTQIRNMAQGLTTYATQNNNQFPGADEDWEQILLNSGWITADMLVSPNAQPGDVSYYYVPGLTSDFESTQVLLYENPDLYGGDASNVCFEDGHVEYLQGPALWAVLDNITLEDGTPYQPHKQQP